MKLYSSLVFLIGLVGLSLRVGAQEVQPDLHLITKISDSKVILRWAPGNPDIWKTGNLKGYYLLRATVPVDKKGLENYHYDTLVTVLKPLQANQWESLVDQDEYCASAWVSLYENRPIPQGDLIQKIKEEEDIKSKAFFLAMLSADHSAKAAEAMGLRYSDDNIITGKKYVYKVGIAGFDDWSAHAFVNTESTSPALSPLPPQVESKEKGVLLSWSAALDQHAFTSYFIEKADREDGVFTRINATAILPLDNPRKEELQYTYFTDSLEQNYKSYYYRLRGMDPFGEYSQPSPVIMGMGRDLTAPPSPDQLRAETIDNRFVKLTWKQVNSGDIKGVYVGRAHDFEDDFQILHENILSGPVTTFIDSFANPKLPNYYRVSVIDTAGNISYSESAFAFFADEEVIATPQNLSGKIDTNGVVTLTWSPVDDPTLIGYRIYFSNSPNHSFIMRSGDLITDTVYTEKITLKTLSEKILYKVAAVDVGYGHSFPSEAIECKKPDRIPPAPGVFTRVEIIDNKVFLAWAPGSSTDMVTQEIWREKEGEKPEFLVSLDKFADHYTDTTLVFESAYTYYLKTQDDDGLYSDFSSPAGVQSNTEIPIAISGLKCKWDSETQSVLLTWDYPNDLVSFIIYRADASMDIRSVGNAVKFEYRDIEVEPGQRYTYAVKVLKANGMISDLSSEVTITTPTRQE